MKTEIYVMTHKACAIPDIAGYVRLQVGTALHGDLGYMRDDEGEDNISDLNPFYAELTGIYRLWRVPTDADNIGICHYRRFFINEEKQIMTMPEYEKMLEDADIIAAIAENDIPYLALFSQAHHKDDLMAAGKAIAELYPEDSWAFEEMLKSYRITYGNLCVMPREQFFSYCEWLFTVLLKSGDYIDVSEYDEYHRKVFGILAESLLWVYINARHLKMKECRAGFFGLKAETEELIRAIKMLIEKGDNDKARELYYETLKRRPDLTSPESDLDGTLSKLVSKL